MTRAKRQQWRREQAECNHPHVEVEEIDGRKYGICTVCKWVMPGEIAESYLRLRSG